MFEIGSSLREARRRQGLELAQVERDTRIRAKYLNALEEERFDVLPAPAYAKGFLRSYADYLGLDGQRFIDEYTSRYPAVDEPPATPLVRARRGRVPGRGPLTAGAIALLLVGLIAWQLGSRGGGTHHLTPPTLPTSTTPTTPPPAPAANRTKHVQPALARITFVAARGPCWLEVRLDSATGKLVWMGTLPQGQSAHFVSRRFWIRVGAPWNADATLNGKPTPLPATTGDVVVASGVLRPAG